MAILGFHSGGHKISSGKVSLQLLQVLRILSVDEGMCVVGSTVFLYDGLQIAVMMGDLCADIYEVYRKGGSLTQQHMTKMFFLIGKYIRKTFCMDTTDLGTHFSGIL